MKAMNQVSWGCKKCVFIRVFNWINESCIFTLHWSWNVAYWRVHKPITAIYWRGRQSGINQIGHKAVTASCATVFSPQYKVTWRKKRGNLGQIWGLCLSQGPPYRDLWEADSGWLFGLFFCLASIIKYPIYWWYSLFPNPLMWELCRWEEGLTGLKINPS